MRRFLLACLIAIPLLVVQLGCGGDPEPPRDPNFTPTDDPSTIDTSKMQEATGGGPAPKQ
jgi:hypothetical protein